MSELICRELEVGYGGRGVCTVDVEFPVGVNVVCGVNGAGKTTLLRTLAGVIPPVSGELDVPGHGPPGREGVLVYLPQTVDLPGWMRLGEAVEVYSWMFGGVAADALTNLSSLGVSEVRGRMRSASVGTRRLVCLASALSARPQVVLLDEPFAGVSLAARLAARRMIDQIATEAVVVVVSHLLEDVTQAAGRVGLVAGGRLDSLEPIETWERRARETGRSMEEYLLDAMLSHGPTAAR